MAQRRADGLRHELARRLVHADVQPVDAERVGDLGADELRQAAAAGHAPREPGDEPAVGDRVVGRALRRRRHRARREALLHRQVVEQVLGPVGDRAHAPQARPMGQQVADGHPLLAARAELGPVGRDRLVVGERAALGEPVDDGRGDALGGREAQRERPRRPRPRVRAVGPARAQVEDGLAADPHDERAAPAAAAHQPAERGGSGAERQLGVAVDAGRERVQERGQRAQPRRDGGDETSMSVRYRPCRNRGGGGSS
jgi:hypothetical protein